MNDDFFEKRKKQLGVQTTDIDSFFERRKAQLAPLSSSQKSALNVEQDEMAEMEEARKASREPVAPPLSENELARQKAGEWFEGSAIGRGTRAVFDAFATGVENIPQLFGLPNEPTQEIVEKYVATPARSLYTPGASAANIAGLAGSVGAGISKAFPSLGSSLAGRAVTGLAQGATVGAIEGAGNALAQGGQFDDAGEAALWGAGIGGILGGAAPAIGDAIGRYRNRNLPTFEEVVAPKVDETPVANVAESTLPKFDEVLNSSAMDEVAPSSELLEGGINPTSSRLGDVLDTNQTQGFSALAKSRLQKTRTPDNPETVKDVIDVGGRQREVDKGSWWERFYTSIVNEQAPLKRAVSSISKEKLPIDKDPEKLAWLSRGWKGKADSKLEYGFFDDAGKRVAGGLKQALDPIRKRLDDWREYAVALRSKEYKDADLISGVPDEIADKAISKFGSDATIKKADEDIKRFIYNAKKSTLVDSGIWSKQKLDDYKDTQPNYIPMFRTQEKGLRTPFQQASGKGFANVKDPTKARTGSKKPIVDPIESIIKQQYKEQALADRNNVMRSLVELAEKNPDNPIMRRVTNTKAVDEIQKSLDDFILNPTDDMETQLRATLDLLKPQTVNGVKNVVTVMRNGKAEQWEVLDAPIAKVLAGLGGEPSNPLVNMIGQATGVLKAGLVLAPDFVAKNLIRDQLGAFINSKYGFIPIWDTASGLWSAMKKDDAFYRWMANGGANGAWVSLERDYLQGQINQLTRSNIKKMGNPIEVMRKLSEWSEQGTRLGEFKRGLKRGASDKEAALASRDVTLDFSRSGSQTKAANKMIAFFNVAVQSMDKMARQFKEQPAMTALKAASSITVPSVALYLYNKDNPKYQELPQWDKDSNWHLFVGDEIVRIPKPFEMGTIFGTFFERLLRQQQEQDPKAFDDFAKQVLKGFTPSVVPTLLSPWIEAYANKDFFTDAPIVPMREQGRKKEDQYGPYTSELAKSAGKLTKQSPRILENYVTGYTGSLGRYGLQAADKAFVSAKGIETPPKPDNGLAGLPVLRSFLSKGLEGSSKSVDDFYKERQKLTEEQTSAKFNEVDNENAKKLKQYNKIADKIGEENKKVRDVIDDKNKTPEQKREELKKLNLAIINLARSAKGLQPIKGD